MGTVSSVLFPQTPDSEQTEFNLQRWDALIADRRFADHTGRIETDADGKLIMSPPAGAAHSGFEGDISYLLRSLMRSGKAYPECPISTAGGVKAADVAWASAETIAALGNRTCFPVAPEICVEVLSPRNTKAEILEKLTLYVGAGAKEVWICGRKGEMAFYDANLKKISESQICPNFPHQLER